MLLSQMNALCRYRQTKRRSTHCPTYEQRSDRLGVGGYAGSLPWAVTPGTSKDYCLTYTFKIYGYSGSRVSAIRWLVNHGNQSVNN
ncbi:hypothetical protein [uncultured Nostoc sp.]|uniref:hypothetical protein n=1 Tax=uncultured Nostoc sp. TaxID=340711 RepID=UPI0035CB880D